MHHTRIDIPEKARRKLAIELNARLADAIDLKFQAKHAHWNVKGPRFIALHELFDRLAAGLDAPIDDMAERITTLAGTANGTLALVAKASTLPAYPAELASGTAHVESLANAYAAFARALRKSIGVAQKQGDDGTADLFTSISQEIDKNLWLLEAHLQAET
ncbi:MAG: DNA starvation/stationary phase protection protein Dps [Gammaproteobacteria bacterium]|jgi:starvation-inducible DNA-binding protein|nr:DNA starvation/stationary phase protection protein Dps [Gammaproteobacteria bacterium]